MLVCSNMGRKTTQQERKDFRDKEFSLKRHVLWSNLTKIELFGCNDHGYIWRKGGEA